MTTAYEMVTAIDLPLRFTSCRPNKMQIVQKVLKLKKIFLAQLVALKYIYNMEFRAKFYLK